MPGRARATSAVLPSRQGGEDLPMSDRRLSTASVGLKQRVPSASPERSAPPGASLERMPSASPERTPKRRPSFCPGVSGISELAKQAFVNGLGRSWAFQPSAGGSWDWPLGRQEKKDRVLMLSQLELLSEIDEFRAGGISEK